MLENRLHEKAKVAFGKFGGGELRQVNCLMLLVYSMYVLLLHHTCLVHLQSRGL